MVTATDNVASMRAVGWKFVVELDRRAHAGNKNDARLKITFVIKLSVLSL